MLLWGAVSERDPEMSEWEPGGGMPVSLSAVKVVRGAVNWNISSCRKRESKSDCLSSGEAKRQETKPKVYSSGLIELQRGLKDYEGHWEGKAKENGIRNSLIPSSILSTGRHRNRQESGRTISDLNTLWWPIVNWCREGKGGTRGGEVK